MALPNNYPLNQVQIGAHSASIGASAAAAYVRAPQRGYLTLFGGVTGGTITSANATVTVAVNGTTVGTFTITVSGAAAGQNFSGSPTALTLVQENDVISFTPAGASGSSIPGSFYAVIREQ